MRRRSENTIPRDEYCELLSSAARRMAKKVARLADEEASRKMKCDDIGDYAKAEKHRFNEEALTWAWEFLCLSPDDIRGMLENGLRATKIRQVTGKPESPQS